MPTTTRRRRKLVEGRMMTCPRCKKQHDILAYVPLRMIEEFVEETTPIYKCPECRWVFAPSENLVLAILKDGLAQKNGSAADDREVART